MFGHDHDRRKGEKGVRARVRGGGGYSPELELLPSSPPPRPLEKLSCSGEA